MHAGIVMLVIFYLVGVTPTASAILSAIGLYRSVRGSDVVLSVLGGLFWPVLVVLVMVWGFYQLVDKAKGGALC